MTFAELKTKNVVNTHDGKCLGKPCDIVITTRNACVIGIVVPGERKFFKATEDVFIPWEKIVKIGEDVILVDMPGLLCG